MASYDKKQIQTLLNNHGYNLAVDGIIGPKSTAAIRDFQKKNGLSVDGIVGPKTWAALTKSNTTKANTTTSKATPPTTTPTSFKYSPSKTTTQAQNQMNADVSALRNYDPYVSAIWGGSAQANSLWNQAMNLQKPVWDGGKWAKPMEDALNAYLNREDFSYDLNGDVLYQQYKDKYMQQGKMAMMDTMGQAAALTGGYGSSYATTAGNQAYQSHLQNLNDIVPELYQMAYDRYNQQGQDMLNAYSLLKGQYDTEYGQHRDDVGDFYSDFERLWGMGNDVYNRDYGEFMDREDMNFKTWQAGFDQLAELAGLSADAFYNTQDFDYNSQRDVYNSNMELQDQARNDVYAMVQSGVMPSDDMLNAAGMGGYKTQLQAMANVYANGSGSSSGGSSSEGSSGGTKGNTGNTGGGSYDNQGLSSDKVKALQGKLGVTADGMAGSKTIAALQEKGYNTLQEAYDKLVGGGGNEPETTYKPNELYEMAYDALIESGVSKFNASRLLTQSEWSMRKSQGSKDAYGDSYTDYVDEFAKIFGVTIN